MKTKKSVKFAVLNTDNDTRLSDEYETIELLIHEMGKSKLDKSNLELALDPENTTFHITEIRRTINYLVISQSYIKQINAKS